MSSDPAHDAQASEAKLAAIPTNIPMTAAGVLAVTGSTALQAVDDHGRVRSGDQVLVLGTSGGVGTYAVQIATAAGGIVTGVASGDELDLVESGQVTPLVDRSFPLFETADAIANLETGRTRGKIVLDIDSKEQR